MKILLLNKYWRHAGGVEVHAFHVAEWLESLGHTVIPFAMQEEDTLPSEYQHYFPDQVDFRAGSPKETFRGVMRATASADSRRKLRELIDVEKPDAAYVLHIYHQLGTALLNELSEAGVPTVLSIHDYKVACPNYRFYSESTNEICMSCTKTKLSFLVAPALKKCWNNSVAAGLALSVEALATKIRRSYLKPQAVTLLNSLQRAAAIHAGIDENKIHLVPHPVNLNPSRENAEADAPYLYMGRLVPEKGVDVLIRAAAISGVRVTIAGDGRSRSELEDLAGSLDAPVEFIGPVERDAVDVLIRSSKALVVPSTWHEVSPLVVYEAIANDVPVIASAVGGMVDQLGDNRGFLVAPGDVDELAGMLKLVASDPGIGIAASRKARRYSAEHWTFEAWSKNMRAAFSMTGVQL